MLRITRALALAVAVSIGLIAPVAAVVTQIETVSPDDQIIYRQRMLNSTVRIETPNGSGSGTVVHSSSRGTYIVTNQHVAERLDNPDLGAHFWIVGSKGTTIIEKTVKVKVLAIDTEKDLALLQVVGPLGFKPTVASVARAGTRLYAGENVMVSGAALGYRVYLTEGMLSIIDAGDKGFGPAVVVTSAPVLPGNSGGGVYHRTKNGQWEYIATVRGVINLGMGGLQASLNFNIPNKVLRDFLREANMSWVLSA